MHKEHRPCSDYKLAKPVRLGEIPLCFIENNREVGQKNIRRRGQLNGLSAFGGGLSRNQKVAIGIGAVLIAYLAFRNRKTIAKVGAQAAAEVKQVAVKAAETVGRLVDKAKLALLKAALPSKADPFVDQAFIVGQKYNVSPYTILAFMWVEGAFKLAADETGDFIPRCVRNSAAENEILSRLPGVKLVKGHTFKKGKAGMVTCDAWVPDTKVRGWGHGPMQIDWMSHQKFLSRPDWYKPDVAVDYAIGQIFKPAWDYFGSLGLSFEKRFKWSVASYNAGLPAAKKAYASNPNMNPDEITFGGNYGRDAWNAAQKYAGVMGGSHTAEYAV